MDISQSDGGTRSGLLWEVERILGECKELGELPQILVMENVPQIHSEKDMPNFTKWMQKLEELGYISYWSDLNGKDYGIPQNRERTFMVSILGKEYLYKFPRPISRKYNLKDFLQNKVDDKYYLSEAMIDYLTGVNQKKSKYDRASRFESSLRLTNEENIAGCITTAAGQRVTDNFILDDLYENREKRIYTEDAPTLRAERSGLKVGVTDDIKVVGNYMPSGHNAGRVVDPQGIAPTVMENHGTVTAIIEEDKENSFIKKAYKEFGSVPELFNPYNKTELTDLAPTQTTQSGSTTSSSTVLIRENTIDGFKEATEGDGINISSRMHHQRGNVQKGLSQTLKTTCEVGVCEFDDNENDLDLNIKKKYCQKLIDNDLVEENDVINHAFASNRIEEIEKGIVRIENTENTNNFPTVTTRVDCLGVVVNDSEFTETEAKLFTEDGHVRRYIGSNQIDKFEEGDMATTTFPNGYGHGPRTHKDLSITLNTIDKPVVKKNLRIRKLTPKEAMRLMGFQDIDADHMYECGLTDSAIFHCAGDSIIVCVLIAIFGKLFGLTQQEIKEIIYGYIETIRNA